MKKKYPFLLLAASVLTLGVLIGCGGGNNGDNSNSGGNSQSSDFSFVNSDGSQSSGGQGDSSKPQAEFKFTAALSNGRNFLNKYEAATVVIEETGGEEDVVREYSYSSTDPDYISVNGDGVVTALKKTEDGKTIRITVTEKKSNKKAFINGLTVIDASPATGGYNFASLAGA